MREFEVEITEMLSKVIKIKANTFEEALESVTKMYKQEKIILDSDNLIENEIKLVNYE